MRRQEKPILTLLIVLSFVFTVSPVQALTVLAPDAVSLGVPFPVRVFGEEALSSVHADWMGRSVPFEPVDTGGQRFWVADLVCPVSGGKSGPQMLLINVGFGGGVTRLPWQIKVTRRSFPVTKLTVDPDKAVPPAAAQDRILRERLEAVKILRAETMPSRWGLPLVRPVSGPVTSPYGAERTFNGKTRSCHSGTDFRASPGTPVLAVAGGTVVLTGDRYFSGETVFVDHGGGRVSLYGHLRKISVRQGQKVEPGEVLGFSGATGRVTGPHLHFGLALHGAMADGTVLFEEDEAGFLKSCRQVSLSLD